MLIKKFFCPANAWDCPYWKEDGSCSMVDDGDDPVMECDDAGYWWGDTDEDPYVWEDEDGNLNPTAANSASTRRDMRMVCTSSRRTRRRCDLL